MFSDAEKLIRDTQNHCHFSQVYFMAEVFKASKLSLNDATGSPDGFRTLPKRLNTAVSKSNTSNSAAQ